MKTIGLDVGRNQSFRGSRLDTFAYAKRQTRDFCVPQHEKCPHPVIIKTIATTSHMNPINRKAEFRLSMTKIIILTGRR